MKTVPSSEEISLGDLRDNRSVAWGAAYERLWKVGWMTAKRKMPYDSPEQIEDLVAQTIANEIVPQIVSPKQEAFVKAATFDDVLNLTSRAVANRAIDEIRRRTRRPENSNIEKVSEAEFAELPDDEKRELAEEVQLALGNLDDRYRVLLEDFYFLELSTDEIARKRGRPKGTVCSDLVKARQMMGIFLESRLEMDFNQ